MVTHDGQSPIVMNTVGDELADIFQGRDMQDPTPVPALYLVGIEFVQGGTGKTIVLHSASEGIAFESPTLEAGENWYVKVDRWVKNLYIQSIPADSKVLVHYA